MKKKQQGFTIIELLIATTVFSVVMIICLAAFLRVGQLYYKGIYLSRTQEATRDISDDIVDQLRLNGNSTGIAAGGTIIGSTGTHNVYYFCAGTKRYSFMSNNVVNTQTESTTNFGLMRDNLPSDGSCKSPTVLALGASRSEMLSDKMRLVATSAVDDRDHTDLYNHCDTTSAHKLCTVHIHIDFGDNDLLVNSSGTSFATPAAVAAKGTCSGPLQGSQFCATSDLDTTVYPLQ